MDTPERTSQAGERGPHSVTQAIPRIAALKNSDAFRTHLTKSGIALEFDDVLAGPADSPLGRPITIDGRRVGNRFCILPMEGWDGTTTGEPSELTARRWRHFGISGAKLMWGCEAVAVRHDGRANPESADDDAARRRADRRPSRGARRRAPRTVRRVCGRRPSRRSAAHALGAVLAPRRTTIVLRR